MPRVQHPAISRDDAVYQKFSFQLSSGDKVEFFTIEILKLLLFDVINAIRYY